MKKLFIFLLSLSFVLILGMGKAYAYDSDDLIGWWKFDGNAEDSADEHDGTESGNFDYVTSEYNQAISLGSGSSYITIPDNTDLDITSGITIEAWIKLSDIEGTYSGIVSKGNSYMLHLDELSGTTFRVCPVFYIGGTYGNWTVGCSSALNYDTWYHVAVTYDSVTGVEATYIDGLPDGSEIRTPGSLIDTNDTALEIGHDSRFALSTRLVKGLIDEVKIWNYALASDEFDFDMDTVVNHDDLCPYTVSDENGWDEPLGTNRWEIRQHEGYLMWYQNGPKEKFDTKSLDYTYGCNGHQILQMLYDKFGNVMNGHWKFGLSSSILEEFHLDMNDGELDGRYFLDTVEVSARNSLGISTTWETIAGVPYDIEVSGTYTFVGWTAPYGIADAEWSNRVAGHTSFGTARWEKGEGFFPTKYGVIDCALDLQINNSCVDWGELSPTNTYSLPFTGNGLPLHFHIYDNAYGDNLGSLSVSIYGNL